MVDGQGLALRSGRARPPTPCPTRSAATRASVSCSCGPRRVEEDHAVAHGGELLGPDHAGGLRGDRGVQRHHVGPLEQLVEGHGGLVGVGVVGDDLHARGPAAASAGPGPRRPGRPVRRSVRPAARPGSVGRGWCRPCRSRPAHVGVGRDDPPGGGEEQGHRQLGHGVGVAARGPQHRNAGGGGRGHVDVVGVAPAAAHGQERSGRTAGRRTGRSRPPRWWPPPRPPARPAARRCRSAARAGRATSRGSGRPVRRAATSPGPRTAAVTRALGR